MPVQNLNHKGDVVMCMMQWLRKVRQWNDVKLLGHIVNRNLDSLRDGVIEFYNRW